MSLEAVAARYARALFEIGMEQNNLAQIADEIRALGDTFAASEDLRSVVSNPLVEVSQRKAVLNEVCQRLGASPVVRNTILLLADRHRLAILPLVSRELDRQAEARRGTLRAHVTTATQMPESYFAQIQSQLEKATGMKVVLDKSVDPSILGGVVTRIGDRVIDGSLRARLESMKSSLLQA